MNFKEMEDLQEKNLNQMLGHLKSDIPYYKKIIEREVFSYEVFSRLPIIDKKTIQQNFDAMTSRDAERRHPYVNFTGGSTGEPLKVIQDKEHARWGRAVKSLYDHWSGLEPGDKQLRLWGSERDVLGIGASHKQRLVRWLKNEKWVNTFVLTDILIKDIIDWINENNPVQITSYVDTAYEVAKFANKEEIKINFDGTLLTSAGTLFPQMEEEIKQAFGCRVFNRYGSREIGDIACSGYESDALKVFDPVHFVEVLDENLNPVGVGEFGDIYITTLKNYSMPLVRYKIGDVGVVHGYNKNGGVSSFSSIEGRSTSVLYDKNKNKVLPAYFIHMFGVVERDFDVDKFQVIQHVDLSFSINIVKKDDFDGEWYCKVSESIRKIVSLVIGEVDVKINLVEDIPKNSSGKYQYVVSEC
ncbi:hypothetical protein KUW00_10375 [Halomonas sp. DP5N14-9]|uniref:hypothetical protein n=1 Tax=Halomonas sp. DP5N14-9 TaxID=2859075 RepID=UPI001C997BE0|nr:hypothetical protein [Halomonas sp. DP5N14-9]MBY5941291.1 hypothetical protein [Halomonas sp. DP5N14-9]